MFPTRLEETSQQLLDISSTLPHNRIRRISLSRQPYIGVDEEQIQKLKKSKEDAMAARIMMTEALKKYRRVQNEISKNDRMAHIAKTSCMKLYEVKKQRLLSKSLIEEKKHKDIEEKETKMQNVRKLKLEEEYFKEVLKNQELFRRFQLKQHRGQYKKSLRDALSYQNKLLLEQNRERYAYARLNKSRHEERKRLIEQITTQKCKQNYLSKLEAEISRIQAYNDLLVKLEEDEKNAVEGLQASKYFEARAVEDVQNFIKSTADKKRVTVSDAGSFFITDRARTSQPRMQS